MKKTLFPLVMLLLLAMGANGQVQLDATIRPLAEFRNGYKKLNTGENTPAALVSQRTRLAAIFTHEWLKMKISLQDVRIWGDETMESTTGVYGDDASVDINEAWAGFSLSEHMQIKIGRQYFEYDDARLLATRNWNQNSISYDAALFRYQKDKWTLDAAASLNNNENKNFGSEYPSGRFKTLDFIHAERKTEKLKSALMLLFTGRTGSDTSLTLYGKLTGGLYFNYQHDRFDGFASAYYQVGRTTAGQKARAYNLNLAGNVKLGRLNINAGTSLLSGNDPGDASADIDRQFDLFYGARHRFYGEMDYFSNLPSGTGGAGLLDIFAGPAFKISEKASVYLMCHYFMNQYKLSSAEGDGNSERLLALETDTGFKVSFSKAVILDGGVACLFPDNTLKMIQHTWQTTSDISSWVWLRLNVSPSFSL